MAIVQATAPGLTSSERAVLGFVEQRNEERIDLLSRAVNIPSATENHAGVRRVGELFASELATIGFEARWVGQEAVHRAGHLVAEHRGSSGARVLIIGHLDTVLQSEPFRRDGTRAYGSGTTDMKSGDVIAVDALRALHAAGRLSDRRVTVVFTGDEEDTGEPYDTSRATLVDVAARSDVALGFEGSHPGVAVVGRRGFSSWRIDVTGSQGHSSGIFGADRGSGAIFEAARILSSFYTELREPYVTLNPSVIAGGTDLEFDSVTFTGRATGKPNVVPKALTIEGDLRYLSAEQLQRTREKMQAIVSAGLPRTSAAIAFADGMPSMEPTAGNQALLALLNQVSADLGAGPIGPEDPLNRGAGDISFVTGLVAGLDGLGGLGSGEHAPGEWVDLGEMTVLTKRAALLLDRLLWAPPR